MKTKITLSQIPFLLLLLFFMSPEGLFAQINSGSVQGEVRTSDNQPARGVTVSVLGTGKKTTTNDEGAFQIKNLKPGNYELGISLVGYQTRNVSVGITAGNQSTVSIDLQVSQKELSEVVITSHGKITEKNSDQIARMPITNLENPQTYNIVGKELMKQQLTVNLTDAFRNAPGVTPALFPSGGIGVLSRGFTTGVDARNGLQSTAGRSSADVANLERIEFIKGPSGTLFGGSISSFGGVVNLVTKKPFSTFGGNVDLSMGSFGLGRLTADINTPLNADKSLLLRVNTALQKQDSYNERGFYNSALFAPSLMYQASDRFSFLVDAELYTVNSIRPTYVNISPASGIISFADLPLDYKRSLLDNDLDAKSDAAKFFAEAKYKLDDSWTSSSNIAYVNEHVERSYQDYPVWIRRDSVTIALSKYGPISNTYTNFQQNFTGKFNTGSIKHTFLGGFNFTQYSSRGMSGSTGVIDTMNVNKDNYKIDRTVVDRAFVPGSFMNWGVSNIGTYGAYVSDVVNFNDRLFAMLSLRYEYIEDKSTGPWAVKYNQSSVSPKLGLVYQPVKEQLSLFVNYMNGYQNNPPSTQPDGTRFTAEPVYAVQYEGGVKAELFSKKVNATLSYYHIGIDNAIRYQADGFVFQDGEQESKGFEFDFTAAPVEGLTVVLGYGFNENLVKSTDVNNGNQVGNAPKHIANYWLNYQFQHGPLRNFGLGAGGNYVSDAYFNENNDLLLPKYHILNATAFYEDTKWRLGFKLNNISNQKSWGYWGAPNPTRNFVANLTIKF